MDSVALLADGDRRDLFTQTAMRMGVSPVIVEKDFWVCWVLNKLFAMAGAPGLVFKGGTSLSKVYGAIQRFSEDVDLSLDRQALGFVGERDPEKATRNRRNQLLEELSAAAEHYVAHTLRSQLEDAFAAVLGPPGPIWRLTPFNDGNNNWGLDFEYPPSLASAYGAIDYVRARVRMEFGARGDQWPADRASIIPYAAEQFSNAFKHPACEVVALAVERTFWEKATLLHAEYHRPPDREMPGRQSRHYYDVVMLGRSGHADAALAQPELLTRVAQHKAAFHGSAWSRYDLAQHRTLRLVPLDQRLGALAHDYREMGPMFFEKPPTLNELMDELRELERRINGQG